MNLRAMFNKLVDVQFAVEAKVNELTLRLEAMKAANKEIDTLAMVDDPKSTSEAIDSHKRVIVDRYNEAVALMKAKPYVEMDYDERRHVSRLVYGALISFEFLQAMDSLYGIDGFNFDDLKVIFNYPILK